MSETFLDAVNDMCDLVATSRFDSVVGVNDDAAFNVLAMGNAAGQEIARRADWQDMLQTSSIASSPHNLPSDFQRVAAGGAIRTSAGAPVRPVTDAGHWSVILTVPSTTAWFFLKGGQVLFSPSSAAVSATMDYYSTKWVQGSSSTLSAIDADDNTFLFPYRLMVKNLVWRWRRRNGLAYDDQLAEFEADLAQEIAANGGVM